MTTEQHNYAYDLPDEPPESMIPYLRACGKFDKHIMLFRMGYIRDPLTEERRRLVHVTCSACGADFWAYKEAPKSEGLCQTSAISYGFLDPVTGKTVESGEPVECSHCGRTVTARHSTYVGHQLILDRAFCLTVTRIRDRIALVGWRAAQIVDGKGVERLDIDKWEAYVVEEKKLVKLVGYIKNIGGLTWYHEWQQRKRCVDTWRAAAECNDEFVLPWNPDILIGSTAENSKLDRYLNIGPDTYPVSYMRFWQRHPNVENLIVQGAGVLFNQILKSYVDSGAYVYPTRTGVPKLGEINWKERRPAQMLHLTKEEFRFAVSMQWDMEAWRFFLSAKAKGLSLKLPEDMEDCVHAGVEWSKRMLEKPEVPEDAAFLLRSVHYLRKQRERYGETCRSDNREHLFNGTYLSDYWRVARLIGADLSDPHVRFPKSLSAAHDRVTREYQQREIDRSRAKRKKENQKYRKQFDELLPRLTPYAFAADGIVCRPCMSPEELEEEGIVLDHCVGSYKSIHAAGKQPIFFVRRESEPDKPWFTLQFRLSNLTVVQNRGKCNCARTEEVKAFEEKFLEHARSVAASLAARARVRANVG